MKKKVLIITYYWPPMGGSGVQRWLKMSRYLTSYGWEPVIFTPENPSFGAVDISLEKDVLHGTEVIRLPIWEPYHLFARLKGKKGNVSAADVSIKQKKSIADRIFLWIRGNLFIPDPRIFWIRPAVKFLPDIINSNGISAVITTGPPHSLHLIGKKLKKKLGIKWVADFRDPWTKWDLYDEFYMLPIIKWTHQRLERKVLQQADEVLSTNNLFRKGFEKLGGRPVKVISNGYDEADFKDFKRKNTKFFTIRHVGMLDEMRDPTAFIIALEQFLKSHIGQSILVEFIGNVAEGYKGKIAKDTFLQKHVIFKPYQPHEEIIRLYSQTDVLLLILTQSSNAAGNTPGKLYEYIASGARILALGPTDGEVAEVLKATNSGIIVPHDQVDQIKASLEQLFNEYSNGMISEQADIEGYSRRAQAKKVAEILDHLQDEII